MSRENSPQNALVIHNDYTTTHCALTRDGVCFDLLAMPNKETSKNLAPSVATLLSKNNIALANLVYLAANQGPAPFTTLRSVLATLNGLAYASQLPLVGVNSLDSALHAIHKDTHECSCVLFNAFCDNVYYAYGSNNKNARGQCPLNDLIATLEHLPVETIHIAGNALELHAQEIASRTSKKLILHEPFSFYPSIEDTALFAYKNWCSGKTEKQLQPLYLRDFIPCTNE